MTCIVDGDGTRWWYKNCQIHCTDSPAWIRPDGAQHWFRNGQLTALTVLLRFGQMGIRHGGSMVAAEPVKSKHGWRHGLSLGPGILQHKHCLS